MQRPARPTRSHCLGTVERTRCNRRGRLRGTRTAVLLLLLALGAAPASADDPEQGAVKGLLTEAASGVRPEPDDAALKTLLEEGLKPWRLVEYLLTRDRQDLAVRLAGLAPGEEFDALRSYAGATPDLRSLAARERELEAARAALPDDSARALAHLESVGRVAGPTGVFSIDAYGMRGDLLTRAGEVAKGIEAYVVAGEDALRLGWRDEAQERFDQALAIAYAAGSFELAARACEGAHAVLELTGDSELVAASEFNLAAVAQMRGDLPGALRHLDESLSRYESIGQLEEMASVRSVRSFVLAELGEFVAAMDEQRALETHYAGRTPDENWAENQMTLGLVRFRLGDEAGAASALATALKTFQALGNRSGEARAQGNLGLAHALGARWDEAIQAYERALVICEETDSLIEAATAKVNIADALKNSAEESLRLTATAPDAPAAVAAQRSLARARKVVESVIPTLRTAGAVGMSCEAELTLGELLLAQGEPERAIEVLQSARDEAGRLRAWRPSLSGTVALGKARLASGDLDGALRECRTAAEDLSRAYSGLTEADLSRARSFMPDVFDTGVAAASKTGSLDDLLYFVEAGRASALLRGLGGRAAALRATLPRELLQRLTDAARSKVQAFTDWQAARPTGDRNKVNEAWRSYDHWRQEEKRVLDEVQRVQVLSASRLAPSRLVAIRDVQARLRGTARPGVRQVFALFNFQGTQALALLIQEKEVRVVSYDPASLPAMRAALGTLAASRDGVLDAEALNQVRRLLIDPLGLPAGATRLYISPDRDLAYAPISVLVPDDWEVVFEPSATTFDLLAERRLRRGRGVLGLGDPDYTDVPDPDALATRGGPRLVPLPGTRVEIEAITGRPEDQRLLSKDATEAGLVAALTAAGPDRAWASMHFACHGLVDVEWPALSCLAVTPGDGEDGFLMSHEVLRLGLRTDLVVLSACQTGRGKFVRGEGVMGLTRAFMFAGAPRVIVSLWDVDDAATSFLMRAFYKEWLAGSSTSTALRQAQIAVRDHEVAATPDKPAHRPWADARFWGAWSLWGLAD